MAMSSDDNPRLSGSERLRLDYQQTTDLLRTLTDARFKLLALVPPLAAQRSRYSVIPAQA
jgi:hypothetical protein